MKDSKAMNETGIVHMHLTGDMVDRIRPYLQEAFELATEGEHCFVTINRAIAISKQRDPAAEQVQEATE